LRLAAARRIASSKDVGKVTVRDALLRPAGRPRRFGWGGVSLLISWLFYPLKKPRQAFFRQSLKNLAKNHF
jgi:hypothetical protein